MDTTTALCIIVPSSFHDKINSIRKTNDRAYPRWEPHINFMFPFVEKEKFPDIEQRLKKVLNNFGKFNLVFNQLGYFPQGSNATFHLKVMDDSKLIELFKLIKEALPEVEINHEKFCPHLTLGQCSRAEVDKKLDDLRLNWLGFGFTCEISDVCLINRSKTDNNVPFSVHTRIGLH